METKHNYKSVLLVDDVDLDNFVSKTIISSYHFSENIHLHTTADSALEFLKQTGKTPDIPFPDVIFIDINMPVIDGFQFIENIKRELKDEMALFKPKLVMLTSSIFNSDRQKAREGFKDIIFIVKPLTEETLKLI